MFYSTTNPGFTRGQHWHRHKVERFLVLRGRGEIRLRKLFTDEVVTFPVSGERPAIVDMPTMWVHSITNTGPDDLDHAVLRRRALRPRPTRHVSPRRSEP